MGLHRRAAVLARSVVTVAVVGALAVGAAACGGGDDGKDAKGKGSSTTTTTIHFSGDDSAAFCTQLADFQSRFNAATLDVDSLPADKRADTWKAALDAISGLQSAASSEIEPAVKLLHQRIEAVLPALAAADYDISKVPASALAELRTTESAAATARIEAYGTQVCRTDDGK